MALRHSEVSDEFKHTPKNYDSALAGDASWKNEKNENEYFPVGKVPNVISVVDSLSAPPTENPLDIYALTETIGRQQINAINWQSGTTVRSTFDVGYDLTKVLVGTYINIQGSAKVIQNGRFLITAKGTGTVDYTNSGVSSSANDEAASPAFATFGHANWDGGTSGDWVRFDGALWGSVIIGNGSRTYDESNNRNYFNRLSKLVTNLEYKEYDANITQSGINDPTTTIIGVNEVGAISWGFSATGTFTGTLNEAFTANKTHLVISGLDSGNSATLIWISSSVITLKTYDNTGALANSLLTSISLTIKVAY